MYVASVCPSVLTYDIMNPAYPTCRHEVFEMSVPPFTIYLQGLFHYVRRNPSLNCLHRRRSLVILGHAGPRWRIRLSLHLVLGLLCRLVHSRGIHSVTLFVHLLSLNRAMCPARPSMYSLLDNLYDIIYTCLMSYPGITFVVA